ncbi:MAG: ATP-binding protein [bacterium]|nr:ATP-binding protein [bacterium]
MTKKTKRYFNTSGPNNPDEHYTLQRENLIEKGLTLANGNRYFTIWAPRQTGKSTYFRILAESLKKQDHKVCQVNLENYQDASLESLFNYLLREIKEYWGIALKSASFADFQNDIASIKKGKCVLIIDEIEGLNPELFNRFLHTIRNLYHSRDNHCLKSVILVGVSNIVGIISDNASPFNIADNLEIPYFSREETLELLHMHEEETGQLLDDDVKNKLSEITANQPGLVNGFANRLVTEYPETNPIQYKQYLETENWYLTKAIDKNISNIINKAKQYRSFVEKLLFSDEPVQFRINDEKTRFLYSQGVITYDEDDNIIFNVPLYKKALIDAFTPTLNGESSYFFRSLEFENFFHDDNSLNFDNLIIDFKEYIKLRSFRYFREKDEDGKYQQIKEAALVYTFETYINLFLRKIKAKTYREAHVGLGISDLIINYEGNEYVVEAKIFRDSFQFRKGKKQLAHYCKSVNITKGIYLVFLANTIKTKAAVENTESIENVDITTYVILYDEEKDF